MTSIYQVYVRSFADGNGDGVGDLVGLRSKLGYLKDDLGVDAIWITPFYRSPMVDHGYDVSDHRDVDPLFGTLADFDALVADAHQRGLRVLIDLIPNHTSDQHPWFQEALTSPPGSPARDRYIWRDEPNNWRSVFGGPAWSYDERSGQYWLHLFAPEQPDLNWRNPEVHGDLEATLRFWLDRGVDGFRIDVAHGLYKDAALRDNPVRVPGGGIDGFGEMESRYSFDQPEVHDVYRRWRRLVESYDGDRVLLGEVFLWDPDRVARYVRDDELHLAFSFLLLGQGWDAENLRRAVESSSPKSAWALSNHDLPRHATRFGSVQRARAGALFLLGLPGTVVVYQGEEVGLEDVEVPPAARQDPLWFRSEGAHPGRDGCRVPIPWTEESPTYGFCPPGVDPWLPMPTGWCGDPSVLALYRAGLALRRSLQGELVWLDDERAPLAYQRGDVRILVNTSDEAVRFEGEVVLASDPSVLAGVLPPDTAAWTRPQPLPPAEL